MFNLNLNSNMGSAESVMKEIGSAIGGIVGTVMEALVTVLKEAAEPVAELVFAIVGDFLKLLYRKIFRPVLMFASSVVIVVSFIMMLVFMFSLIAWTDRKYEAMVKYNIENRNNPGYIEYRKTKTDYGKKLGCSVLALVIGGGLFATSIFIRPGEEKKNTDKEKFNSYQKLKQIK